MQYTQESLAETPMEQRIEAMLFGLQTLTFHMNASIVEFYISEVEVKLKAQPGALVADIVVERDGELLVHYRARSEGTTISIPKSSVDEKNLVEYLEKFLVMVTYAIHRSFIKEHCDNRTTLIPPQE